MAIQQRPLSGASSTRQMFPADERVSDVLTTGESRTRCPLGLLHAFCFLIPFLVLLSACESGREEASETVRLPEWQISDSPALKIGAVDGDPAYLLDWVQDVARLSDGRIVIVESVELRYYDAQGRYIRSVGGAGDGPGEFQSIGQTLRLPGDTLIVWDDRRRAKSWFDQHGDFVRSERMEVQQGAQLLLPNDRFLVTTPVVQGHGPEASGQPNRLAIVEGGGDRVDLGVYPGGAGVNVRVGERWVSVERPFWPMAPAFLGPRELVVGDNSRPEVDVYGFDGQLIRTVILDREARPVTSSDLESARESAASPYPEDRRADFLRAWQQVEKPEVFPYYLLALPDRTGNIWVADYAAEFFGDPSGLPPLRWLVIDHEGDKLARTTTPAGLFPFEIGADYIVGLSVDELGVQSVLLYDLIKE